MKSSNMTLILTAAFVVSTLAVAAAGASTLAIQSCDPCYSKCLDAGPEGTHLYAECVSQCTMTCIGDGPYGWAAPNNLGLRQD